MNGVTVVNTCLPKWLKGGESECRAFLVPLHSTPPNPNVLGDIFTAYQTLLFSTLSSWTSEGILSPDAFVAFVQSVLNSLPSSSSSSTTTSSNTALFKEQVVDMIWTVDTELDEIVADAKATIAKNGAQESPGDKSLALSKAKKAKQDAESDKDRIISIVTQFMNLGVTSPAIARERLDSSILANVGIFADKITLDKRDIRTRTGLFFKQNKFNLLREQSEGYSKLTTELTSNLGPAHSSSTGRPTEPWSVIEERARPVWEKITSLIGYFDLDPIRALDIILDVLSTHLATHYTFFIALLSFSPWAGSYRKHAKETPMSVDESESRYKGKTLHQVLSLADPRSNSETPSASQKPSVLAQVLGFKFVYYSGPDVSEQTPRNLYLTAALLIREKFIVLEDLYPHLSLSDADMEQSHQAYLADIKSRIAAAKISQLAMAAPLESTPSSSKAKASTPAEQKHENEFKDRYTQKSGMIAALLAVGAMKPALWLLSKFPWMVDAQPEIADLMIRIMKLSIQPLYDSILVTKERNPSFLQPRARYGTTGVTQPPPRKQVLTLWAPTPPCSATTEFVFFFPDWSEQIPICSTPDDLVDVIEPLMRFIGLHVSRDTIFLTKFLRLGRTQLQSTVEVNPVTKRPLGEPDPEDPIRVFWFRVLRMYLLPALTLIRGNAVCTVEVWNIIRQYETTARWRLYGEWKSHIYDSHPELGVRRVEADRESKGILRRLSHNTIDSLSGTVAKLAHSNPCIFFINAVNQIMAYDNLASVVIQALRFVTNMGFDVLVFIILDALSNQKKERVKDDGVNTSDWLQSLASFTGMLFRRYSADLTPVLKYIVHQLQNGMTSEIVVLRELIWKMAGVEPLPSLSDSQIMAMAGGPALRIEAIASATRGARLDPAEASLKGPSRLGKTLVDSGLALPLLIQVAQQRQSSIYKAPDAHLKSLASLYDTTHGVLLQYLELLTSPSVVPAEDYGNKIIPPIRELGEKYGICAPICMQIVRPVLHDALLKTALAKDEQNRLASEEAEKRLKAALTAKREPSAAVSRVASPAVVSTNPSEANDEAKAEPGNDDVVMEVEPAATSNAPESPWVPELAALFDDVKRIAPERAINTIGLGFYLTFWQLSTYDLSPPMAKYDEEGATLRALSRQEDSRYVAADRSADRQKRLTAAAHRSKRDRYNQLVNTLNRELKQQIISREYTQKRLAQEKQYWFAHLSSKRNLALVEAMLEHCIYPRCLLSPMDADYTAQMIRLLHTQGTPGFQTIVCYNLLLSDDVKVVLFSCSEYEARNYGRFLHAILTDLYKWHSDEQAWLSDNRSTVKGKTVIHPGFQNRPGQTGHISHLEFQKLLRKWHMKLVGAFIDSIETGEFMHVYNAILVLKEILPVFPLSTVATHGGVKLNHAMEKFLENEKRGDLMILGRAYAATLKKREPFWMPPKVLPPKPNGTAASVKAPTNNAAPDKPRSVVLPTGPSAQSTINGEIRRSNSQTSSTPSAPRSHAGNGATENDKRPPVVRRVARDSGNESPRPSVADILGKPSAQTGRATPTGPAPSKEDATLSRRSQPPSRHDSPVAATDLPLPPHPVARDAGLTAANSALGKEPPQSPRSHRVGDDKVNKIDIQPTMPPPSVPSQTPSAQELRETAKQSILQKAAEDRNTRPVVESRSRNGSAAPSPRHRSTSPPSGPGTRNSSADSRTSRTRSDRRPTDGDEKKVDRESRETREPGPPTRRDSITHTRSERAGRERTSTREGDKDGEREKDRDRERDRGRDRHERERDKDRDRDRGERDRERGRDRDRDRERDRDRHRRGGDDKERDRERKERDSHNRGPSATVPSPSETTRPSRSQVDDNLGKRRRGEEEAERTLKRGSHKEGHDRTRRTEKYGREWDRVRRKDMVPSDTDGRDATGNAEKNSDKRPPPEAPSSLTKVLPPSTPSAPRAMHPTPNSDPARKPETNAGRDRHRDHHNSPPPRSFSSSGTSNVVVPPENLAQNVGGSLRDRISDKGSTALSPSYSGRPERDEDDRDGRKRTISDRDDTGAESLEPTIKRAKLIRDRTRYSRQNNPAKDYLLGDNTRRGGGGRR
ncbi:transcription factor/nuclear export subunit protein 2-domain-containing protein [Armillaria mellea]|nr:transcription factor/nuclear export subunit protein 2-domain-containing protein [Armillaria mellea]